MYLLPKITVFGPQEKGSGETNVNEDGAYIYSLSPGYTYIFHVSVVSSLPEDELQKNEHVTVGHSCLSPCLTV